MISANINTIYILLLEAVAKIIRFIYSLYPVYRSSMQIAFTQAILDYLKSRTANAFNLSGGTLDYVFALCIVLFFAILAEVIFYLINSVLPGITAKTKTKLDDEILKALRGPIRLFIVLIGLSIALHTLALSNEQFKIIDQVFAVLTIFVGAYFVLRILKGFSNWYMMEVAPKTATPIDDQLVPFLYHIFKIFVYALAVLMALGALGYEITPLIAGVGIAGVTIALAAQASLTDIFGSLNIMADRPYKVGDRIKFVGSEDRKGDVIDIGLRSTRIRLLDDTILIIPNSIVAKEKIINESDPDPRMRVILNIPVSYKSDFEKVTQILLDVAGKTEGVAKDPYPRVYIVDFLDFSIKVEFRIWVEHYKDYKLVPNKVYRAVLKRFKEEGIEIPYPVRIVRKADDFELEFR